MSDEFAPVCLPGTHVRLRPMSVADAGSMYAIHSDPRVSRFTSTRPAHQALEETEAMIRNMLRRPGAQLWMVDGLGADATSMRGCGWLGLFSAREGVADITINLRRDAQDLRRAREAGVRVMLQGFEQRGLHRISADIDADNGGCIRLVESLGFSYEGRLRQCWKTPLGWRDSVIYSVLASDLEHLMPRWSRHIRPARA